MPVFRRTDAAGSGSGGTADPATQDPDDMPNVSGDIDALLSTAPCFRIRVRGYDPLQVDNFVAWAESELATARRELDHVLARYGVCSAELEIARRLLAQVPRGQDVSPVTDRLRNMLQLAAEEGRAMVEAASQEADRLRAEARMEADARLRKAREIKELAADTADEMTEQAERDRAEAAATLQAARTQAAEMLGDAASERDRLAAEAAEAQVRLAAMRMEIDDLGRRRDDARSSLRLLTDRIGQALEAVTGGPQGGFLLLDNQVESLDDRIEALDDRAGSLSS